MIRILFPLILLAAPATAIAASGMATATLKDANGKKMGTATARDSGNGIEVTVKAKGLEPGERAWHLHSVGKCEDAKFISAGPHWNPTARMHGKDNPMGPHAGDLPNLTAGAKGKAKASYDVHGAKLSGEGGLLDADGGAIVIHAKADDYKTDPAGAAGDRIACGVFASR